MLVLLQAKQKRQPKEKDYFWVQQMPVTDASNIKYVDTIGNNILSGSETFQGDINIFQDHSFTKFQLLVRLSLPCKRRGISALCSTAIFALRIILLTFVNLHFIICEILAISGNIFQRPLLNCWFICLYLRSWITVIPFCMAYQPTL